LLAFTSFLVKDIIKASDEQPDGGLSGVMQWEGVLSFHALSVGSLLPTVFRSQEAPDLFLWRLHDLSVVDYILGHWRST
jgi:hypothetical protein